MLKPAVLLAILAASLLVLAVILYVIWVNRGTEKTIGILVKAVVAPLILAAFLLASEFFSPLETEKDRVVVLVPRNEKHCQVIYNHLRTTSNRGEVFNLASQVRWQFRNVTAALDKDPSLFRGKKYSEINQLEIDSFFGVVYLDRMEVIFYNWLINKYPHWEVERFSVETMSGSSGGMQHKKDAEKNPVRISKKRILNEIASNNFIILANQNSIDDKWFGLPSTTTDALIKVFRRPRYK